MREEGSRRRARTGAIVLGLIACLAGALGAPASAQTVRGRVIDPSNERPVQLAAVALLDRDHGQVVVTLADSAGWFALDVPEAGEYYLFAHRLGYHETLSPLLAISDTLAYELDLELRPEPIGLDPITVTVRNEELLRWWQLRFGINPSEIPGFRVVQGERLDEAKRRAADNTGILRFLYIPITHGHDVCIGVSPRAVRGGWHRAPPVTPPAAVAGFQSCGKLYLNDEQVANDQIESIDMAAVTVIATYWGAVHLYTGDFDGSFRGRR